MDPGFVLETLTMAIMVPVPLPGRVTTLIDATDDDLEEIRGDKGRTGAIAIVKKALKIAELTKELRTQMSQAGIKQVQPPSKKKGRQPPQAGVGTELALATFDGGPDALNNQLHE